MAITQQSSLDFSQKAYDRLAYYALRPELYFDQAADVMPTAQSMPGSSVQFTIVNDLAVAAGTISETTDISPVALSDSTVSVTLAEYGNAVLTSAKLRGTSFVEIDPIVANVIGYNAGLSLDTIARNTLRDFVMYNGTSYWNNAGAGTLTATVTGTPAGGNVSTAWSGTGATAKGTDFAKARTQLRASNVATFGGFYVAYVHPDTVYDIQQDTGTAGWRLPHIYSQPAEIWSGEIGAFEGVRFIETPRAAVYPDSGAASDQQTSGISGNPAGDVYLSVILGRQGLAKAHSIVDGNGAVPHIVPGPITDSLRRFVPMGWYWLGGYSGFRKASVRAVASISSLSYNDATLAPADQ